uniref:THAP domain-containing protein 1 n=1 Tax=Acanthochromis polyacanthus TaxID=80966 RepID=A0A3Q1ER92_9TELE
PILSPEHCSVPLCQASSRYNSVLSFHSVPDDPETRRKWKVAIRRDNFTITDRTRVCSRHFTPDDFRDTAGRRLLKKGVVPSLFQWNSFFLPPQRPGVWQRTERPAVAVVDSEPEDAPEEAAASVNSPGHRDNASLPDPAVVDLALEENRSLIEEIKHLREEMERMTLRQRVLTLQFRLSHLKLCLCAHECQ